MVSLFAAADNQAFSAQSRLLGQQILRIQDPPRQLVLHWSMKLSICVCGLVSLLATSSVLSIIRDGWQVSTDSFLFCVLALVIAAPVGLRLLFLLVHERALFKTGKCCVGTVVSQKIVGSGRHRKSEIVYEFPVDGHKPMTGRRFDWTKGYGVKAPLFVFYDPEDISKNVAAPCTGWRVRTKAGYLLEP